MIYCDPCGIVPVPYADLPVILPTDAVVPPSGENALKFHEGFLHTKCPKCGGDSHSAKLTPWIPSCARRGTTMRT